MAWLLGAVARLLGGELSAASSCLCLFLSRSSVCALICLCLWVCSVWPFLFFFFFFKQKTAYEIHCVTGVQTCALPICAVLIDGAGGLRLRRTRHAAGADVARCAGPEVTRIAPSGGLASSRSTRSDASRSSSPRAQHQRRRRLWYGSSRRGPVSDRRRVDAAAARGVLRAAEAGPIAHTRSEERRGGRG